MPGSGSYLVQICMFISGSGFQVHIRCKAGQQVSFLVSGGGTPQDEAKVGGRCLQRGLRTLIFNHMEG